LCLVLFTKKVKTVKHIKTDTYATNTILTAVKQESKSKLLYELLTVE